MVKTITIADLQSLLEEAYQKTRKLKGGKNADYIPFLAQVNPELFAISITLPTGNIIEIGDTDYIFGIESISKVHTAILILQQYGAEEILKKIGADATGLPFNSVMAILLESDHPSTPLVNAGAISADSMVCPIGNAKKKWKAITDNLTALCGSELTLLEELYQSETETNYNNKAIAWLLKKYNRIYDEPELSLDLYTRQCSMGISCTQLAISACTIAHRGKNPITDKQVFSPQYMPQVISLMSTVGFYEHTGNWMYSCGIPAKSGVGGGIMGVIPGVLGIAAFSPCLDSSGNSVRAQAAIKYIAQKLDLNIYNGNTLTITT